MLPTTARKSGDRGHVAEHNEMATRLICASDYPSIQEAINQAAAKKCGVRFQAGTYYIYQTINCISGVSLRFDDGVILRAAEDVDMFHCAPKAHISGGRFDVDAISFTHSVFDISGADLFYIAEPARFQNIQINGNDKGTGFNFHAGTAGADPNYIYGCVLDNVALNHLEYGIHSYSEGNSAGINGNTFSNIYLHGCKRNIQWELGGGNNFSNIMIQPRAGCERALYIGNGEFNSFTNMFVWDWNYPKLVSSLTAIELSDKSANNTIFTGLSDGNFLDAGTNNKIISAYDGIHGDTKYMPGFGPVVTSPNGTRYRLTVDDAGNVTAKA